MMKTTKFSLLLIAGVLLMNQYSAQEEALAPDGDDTTANIDDASETSQTLRLIPLHSQKLQLISRLSHLVKS